MLRPFVLLCSFVAVNPPLWCQLDVPPLEVFGAYSHVGNYDVGLNGWLATATYNWSNRLGAEGDVNGGYGTKVLFSGTDILPLPNSVHSRIHNFDFGPRLAAHSYWRQFTVFAHILFGVSHTHLSAADVVRGDTAFSWVLGGGGDVNLTATWGLRVQVDLLQTHFFNDFENHGRISLGLVYRFYP